MKKIISLVLLSMFLLAGSALAAPKFQNQKGEMKTIANGHVKNLSNLINVPGVAYGYGCGGVDCQGEIIIDYDPLIKWVLFYSNGKRLSAMSPQRFQFYGELESFTAQEPRTIRIPFFVTDPGLFDVEVHIYYDKKTAVHYENQFAFQDFAVWISNIEHVGGNVEIRYQLTPQFGLDLSTVNSAQVLLNERTYEGMVYTESVYGWENYFLNISISEEEFQLMLRSDMVTVFELDNGASVVSELWYY